MLRSPALEFRGTSRFEVRARIGQGAFGMVYDAFDRERSTRVAVKTLRVVDAETLLSLKNEFRAVQDLQHPNLVSLGELFESNGTWFFTMEFVQGMHFVAYARPDDPLARKASDSSPPPSQAHARPPTAAGFDEERLRGALVQLVRGVSALHDANKLHRDLKPSNILVTEAGRVVILDFGVSRDLTFTDERANADEGVVGTALYMAPEQALGERVSAAADWYALGVVLYQALAGRLPFLGGTHDVLEQKVQAEPPPPSAFDAFVPPDLDALCIDLLRIAPESRPSGHQILARLGAASKTGMKAASPAAVFVGHREELAALATAYAETAPERPARRAVTVCIHGESGVGKSFLARRFLDDVRERLPATVVLAGRCYEREAVPYKAIDGVVDELSQLLRALPEEDVDAIVGTDLALLARAFPVLRLVRVSREADALEIVNPREIRARLFAALRGTFTRLASRSPLVTMIDDMQWADEDSLSLLNELMRPPDAPAMLLLTTIRVATTRHPDAARGAITALCTGGDMRHLQVEPLRREEARELAVLLVGSRPTTDAEIDAIVDDAHGHPQFIDELVRHRGADASAPVLKLDDALWSRVTELDPTARRLLELVAIAGSPITQEIAADAAAIDIAQLFRSGAILRAQNFVKTSGASKEDTIETYHNRVRESVVAHVDRELARKWHGRLAAALERVDSADAEALATHWEGAGHRPRAAEYAERAADDAVGALAFERAARLYRRALELGGEKRDAEDIKRRLVDALMSGGYIAEAADVQLELARTTKGDAALDLQRRAAENLMCSGHYQQGIALLHQVLRAFGVHFPRTPLDVIVSLLVARLVLWARGLSFRERDASAIDPHALVANDAVCSAGAGFAMTDNIRGAYFQTRNLLSALQVGDLHRIVRALGMEICFRAAGGSATRDATRRLLDRERELCLRVGTPLTAAYLLTTTAYTHFMVGEWRGAVEHFTAGEAIYRDRCTGVAFDLSSLRILLYRAMGYLGDVKGLAARAPAALREAEKQGDLQAMTTFQTGPMVLLGLAADEPDRVAAEVASATARLAPGTFLIQHYFAMMGRCQLDLYRGDALTARRRVEEAWPALRRSLLLRVQLIRLGAMEQRARCAIGAACVTADHAERAALLRAAERDARRIEREPVPFARAQCALTRASIAATRGQVDVAIAGFDDAARRFAEEHMALYAAACGRRAGELRGGPEGDRVVREADDAFAAEGVCDAERFSRTIAARVPARPEGG